MSKFITMRSAAATAALVLGISWGSAFAASVSSTSHTGPRSGGAPGANHIATIHAQGAGTAAVSTNNNRVNIGISSGPSAGQSAAVGAGFTSQGGVVAHGSQRPSGSNTVTTHTITVSPE
jgi:hypothetical protein